jgi:hypothetical protein
MTMALSCAIVAVPSTSSATQSPRSVRTMILIVVAIGGAGSPQKDKRKKKSVLILHT